LQVETLQTQYEDSKRSSRLQELQRRQNGSSIVMVVTLLE
jgi:hypothetical protein